MFGLALLFLLAVITAEEQVAHEEDVRDEFLYGTDVARDFLGFVQLSHVCRVVDHVAHHPLRLQEDEAHVAHYEEKQPDEHENVDLSLHRLESLVRLDRHADLIVDDTAHDKQHCDHGYLKRLVESPDDDPSGVVLDAEIDLTVFALVGPRVVFVMRDQKAHIDERDEEENDLDLNQPESRLA